MEGFALIGTDAVRVGGKEYKLLHHDFHNGETHRIEVAGAPDSGYIEVLTLSQLANVRPMDFPRGFSLDIYNPSIPTCPEIDGVTIKNRFGRAICNFNICFIHSQWHGDTNLAKFCKDLAARLIKEIDGAFRVSTEDEEVGVRVICETNIPSHSDLKLYLMELGSKVCALIDPSISKTTMTKAIPNPSSTNLKPDEYGFKWWLRYVVIPVLGSASVVALVTWIAKQA